MEELSNWITDGLSGVQGSRGVTSISEGRIHCHKDRLIGKLMNRSTVYLLLAWAYLFQISCRVVLGTFLSEQVKKS